MASDLSEDNEVEEVTHTYGAALKGFAAEIPAGKVDDVRSDPRVEFVADDQVVHASAQTRPTGIRRADADVSSVLAGNGSGAVGVDIAILDTGIYSKHPDLTIAGGKDCSIDDGKSTYSDDNGHGSHVAGTAAAEDNATGVVGTAQGARLWAVKVLDATGSGILSDIICGIDWVTLNADIIEVANMSLGAPALNRRGIWYAADDGDCGTGDSTVTAADAQHQAICESVDAGVTYVVAVGNERDNSSWYYPAAFDEVITVSALADYNGLPGGGASPTCDRWGADDTFASFSNFGTDVDIGAPGVCIKSTWKGVKKNRRLVPGYKTISGTSMASPHVAGAAAVYAANNPEASPALVKSFMVASGNTEPLGSDHRDPSHNHPEPVLQMDNY